MQRTKWLGLLTVLAVACGGGPMAPDPSEQTFAPELGIDFSMMTRTASGLYVQDLRAGSGAEARAGHTVRVLYQGWLRDGRRFDAALDRNAPLEFPLGVGFVIAGWDQGVAGMRVGGIRRLVIPSALGYGGRATGSIPANSTLVFEIELLGLR